ncbi:MAG: MaoC family dehydratase N-terminal domain-containing protein [Nitrososphaerota archaeon]|nr:MaoC family dehydratase N-terminal domain-containing protein [Nitrososphaerota archaeon]
MYYEDFEVGSKQVTFGRTLTETDIVLFAGLTGASNPLFLDEEYSKKTTFGHRIAPGLLTLSIATGCAYQLPTGPFGEGFVALLGMSFKVMKPVFAGETLKVTVTVREKRPPKEGRGVVILDMTVFNQREETVMTVEGTFMVRVKGE